MFDNLVLGLMGEGRLFDNLVVGLMGEVLFDIPSEVSSLIVS